MNNNDKLRRSNMVLVILILLMLIYGIVYRIQSGDTTLHIFGLTIDLPFGQQETTVEEAPESEGTSGGVWSLPAVVEEALG